MKGLSEKYLNTKVGSTDSKRRGWKEEKRPDWEGLRKACFTGGLIYKGRSLPL